MPLSGGTKPKQFENALGDAPNVRLAHGPGAQGDNVLMSDGIKPLGSDSYPALLVSYFYLDQFQKNRHRYLYRDWVIDSGAFSAHNSGVTITLEEYIDCCKRLMATDPTLTEIYALDVIGDWKASLKNTEKMWAAGVPAIPCFHAKEPWDVLIGMARDYPKIALGGVALAKSGQKMPWAQQCFARVWPKKIHGFAFGSEKAILSLPFHSVDATNWEIGPCKYGRWAAFGNAQISVRGSQQNLRAEVEYYLEVERKARVRWKKEMEQLESLAPTVRLSYSTGGSGQVSNIAFGGGKPSDHYSPPKPDGPTMRLVAQCNDNDAIRRALEGGGSPTVRLVGANDGGQGAARVFAKAIGPDTGLPCEPPSVRLAMGGEGDSAGSNRAEKISEAFGPPKKKG